jgi:hypothetical protein
MSLTPFRQFCTWNERTSSELYGPVYTPHTNTPCRYTEEQSRVKKPNNTEVISNAFIRTSAHVKADDQIIYGGVTYPVLSVRSIPGVGGGLIEYEIRL